MSLCTSNECETNFLNSFSWNLCLDLCPIECNKTRYTVDLSSLQVGGDYYLYLLRSKPNLESDFVTQIITESVALKNFVELQISYDSLSYEIAKETPKMNAVDLVASIGGNLSLFLGVSIFSVFEILEILIEVHFIKKKHLYQINF